MFLRKQQSKILAKSCAQIFQRNPFSEILLITSLLGRSEIALLTLVAKYPPVRHTRLRVNDDFIVGLVQNRLSVRTEGHWTFYQNLNAIQQSALATLIPTFYQLLSKAIRTLPSLIRESEAQLSRFLNLSSDDSAIKDAKVRGTGRFKGSNDLDSRTQGLNSRCKAAKDLDFRSKSAKFSCNRQKTRAKSCQKSVLK